MDDEQQQDESRETESPPANESVVEQQPTAPACCNRSLGVLILVIVLAMAASGAYYLWLQDGRIKNNASNNDAATAELRTQLQQQSDALLQLQTADRNQQAAFEQSLQTLHDELGRGRLGRIVAEVEYLIRIANYRIQLQRDVSSAIHALDAADKILHDSGEPALLKVRDALITELNTLRGVAVPDINGLSLTLSSLAAGVDKLPLKGSSNKRMTKPAGENVGEKPKVEGWRDIAQTMWTDIKGLVEIKRHDQPVMPMLSPKETFFLYENLRLKLEAARIALLRQDQVLFRSNLQTARQWLDSYFDDSHSAFKGMKETLARLETTVIAPDIPVISSSLQALRKYRQKKSGGKP